MRTIGLIGGMSWESSLEYYRIINETVKTRLGGLHSADCLMYSFDFEEIEALQSRNAWDEADKRMIEAAQRLERGGAACIIICTNTMHKCAPAIEAVVDLPLIHIADPTGEAIKTRGFDTIGLLGTRYTMEQDFYRARLEQNHHLNVLIPDEQGRDIVHRIIYEELVKGIIREESRQAYVDVINALHQRGAQGIILGCTEIGLLIKPEHAICPVFDTTYLHAVAGAEFALNMQESR